MAVNELVQSVSIEAGADLSANQFRAVVVDGNGQVALAGADVPIAGYLLNKPSAQGDPANVQIGGIAKVLVGTGGATASGVAVTASDGVTNASITDVVVGTFLTSGAAGEVVEVLMINMGALAV